MSRPYTPGPPPDAGASYLGAYGLMNAWAIWLATRRPDLAELTPLELQALMHAAAPRCPDDHCRALMVARAGEWVCYRHPRPLRLKDGMRLSRAPRFDALAHAGDVLDYQRDEDGTWRVLVNGEAAP